MNVKVDEGRRRERRERICPLMSRVRIETSLIQDRGKGPARDGEREGGRGEGGGRGGEASHSRRGNEESYPRGPGTAMGSPKISVYFRSAAESVYVRLLKTHYQRS